MKSRTSLELIRKWLHFSSYRESLDVLLQLAPSESSELRVRLEWLEKLVNWVRTTGPNSEELRQKIGHLETARSRYFFQVLERNPALRPRVARCLRSILRDCRALELFMDVGVSAQKEFLTEFIDRLSSRVLPRSISERDLIEVFTRIFKYQEDVEWVRRMDSQVFQSWVDLFFFESDDQKWNTLEKDARDALELLAHSARTLGLSKLVRTRVSEADFRKLPFHRLSQDVEALLADTSAERLERVRETLRLCFAAMDQVNVYLREHGASIDLVYQTQCLRNQLRRVRTLAEVLGPRAGDPYFVQEFFSLLLEESLNARRLRPLLRDNLVLICQKIVETNAEVGEHYITRDRKEYFTILKKSWGGGFVTGFTTAAKFGLAGVSAPPFISGVFAFANFSISFLALQAMGFTLATKQPAMTATAIASKIEESSDSIEPLVREVVHLVRSQLAAVFGNLTTVVPTVVVLSFLFSGIGAPLVDADYARKTIDSFSFLGMTPLYAAFTGLLLWTSSVFAGGFGNWFNFRGIPEAIEHSPRLKYVFGEARARRFAELCRKHAAGVAANLSLAFLLGMTPFLAQFLGFPVDVRHVTLSTGALTASSYTLGAEVFSSVEFWLAIGGILSMAVLNLAVSFALALTVALWSKRASAPRRGIVYRALWRELLARPGVFFFPSKHLK